MNKPNPESDVSLPTELIPLLERFCDRFESTLKAGEFPSIEAYLEEIPGSGRAALLWQLVILEREYRGQRGELPTVDEYLARFPDSNTVVRGAFAESPNVAAEALSTSLTDQLDDFGCASSVASFPAAIGKYLVVGRFPHSGQAEVYRVVHPQFQQERVLKLAKQRVGPDGRSEILEEGKILAELEHPHLIRVYDLDFLDDRPYLVMEYIRGHNLEQYAGEGPLSSRQAAALVAKVAGAAGFAHRRGIVHRDIKPRNILVDEAGGPRLIDFGMARLRTAWSDDRKGPDGGTFAFMAPEQARIESPEDRQKVGPRSDVFALGATLYFLLTGQAPFRGDTRRESWDRARRCDFDAAALNCRKIPAALRRICLKAMAADPADRYASAEALTKALESFLRRPVLLTWLALAMLIPTAAVVAWSTWPGPAHTPTHPTGIQPQPAVPPPLSGDINVWIWDPNDPARQRLALNDPGAMPLRAGDQIRVEVKVNRPAHLYLVWIDSDGVAQPVYPWKPGDWGAISAEDRPVTHVSLPMSEGKGWEMKKGAAGMETLVFLARESPIDLELKSQVAGLPRPVLKDARSLVWFDDWALVRTSGTSKHVTESPDRGPSFFETDIKDPVMQTQELLKDRLGAHFSMMRAVSFANQGG